MHGHRRCGGERYKSCRNRLQHIRRSSPAAYTAIKDRVMIDERDPQADGTRFGDWEMDTIVGKDGRGAILTLVERSKDYLLMRKLPQGKNAQALARTAVAMLTPFIGTIRSITTDNGSEFACHKFIAQRLKTKVYFAQTYCSWEKGNIENTNKLIGQYIPKGTAFEQYDDNRIKQIQMKINARPRKKLNFATPKQEFYNLII